MFLSHHEVLDTYPSHVLHEDGQDLVALVATKILNDALVLDILEQLDLAFERLHFLYNRIISSGLRLILEADNSLRSLEREAQDYCRNDSAVMTFKPKRQ